MLISQSINQSIILFFNVA